ncbi:hypothetical protein [Acinetobacter sp. CFCC 10889]|uniref:hypothetical protein n=1 Tax=Acinetobacter sp. CFCC 10889 TaxID=1775557 RepID=UPI0013A68971|nr:hypothetical protein [Acinetobacter sp. CFCC 10889]
MASPLDIVNAAEALAKKQSGIFLKKYPKATKQEIFQRAFLMGMTTGVEMLTYKEKQK